MLKSDLVTKNLLIGNILQLLFFLSEVELVIRKVNSFLGKKVKKQIEKQM